MCLTNNWIPNYQHNYADPGSAKNDFVLRYANEQNLLNQKKLRFAIQNITKLIL